MGSHSEAIHGVEAKHRRNAQGEARRARILEQAARVFAEKGFADARLEDIAAAAGITRPGVLRHFGSKEAVFVAAYKESLATMPTWFDAPEDVLAKGFFAIVHYWFLEAARLSDTPHSIPYQMYWQAKFCSDMSVHFAITRFMRSEDPERTLDLVDYGMSSGEIDPGLDPRLVAAFIDWVEDGFEGSGFADVFDRGGVFRGRTQHPDVADAMADAVVKLLRRAIGTGASAGVPRPTARRTARPAH